MTATDGSDAILLMLTGVTVVIITLRLMVRAHRNKQKAIKQQYSARSRATPGNATPITTTHPFPDHVTFCEVAPGPELARRSRGARSNGRGPAEAGLADV